MPPNEDAGRGRGWPNGERHLGVGLRSSKIDLRELGNGC